LSTHARLRGTRRTLRGTDRQGPRHRPHNLHAWTDAFQVVSGARPR